MKKPSWRKIIVGVCVVVAVVATLFFERAPINKILNLVENYSSNHSAVLEEFKQEIFSAPLRGSFSGSGAALSPSNIITLTNQERAKAGSASLKENASLDKSAMLKVQDIFNRQYFDHISPDGNGPGYLADTAGYSYVVIGENLALGNFKDDAALIKAWMDSPGHRENILNVRYQDIGVAVGQGIFDGDRVYVAVQEFGKPTSACPSATSAERSSIDSARANVDSLNSEITDDKNTLDKMPRTTAEEDSAYNAKVTEYNNTVSEYNAAVSDLRAMIDAYNQHVRDFNACATQ